MKYQIYSIYDNDLRQTSDLFLSANDDTARRTFEEHKRRIRNNNPMMDLNYLKLINLGEYNTEINVNYDASVNMIVNIEPLINPNEPYFVENPPLDKPERLKLHEADVKRNEFFKILAGDKR